MIAEGPLAGVRVLDFTTTFSGPYCTQQLADLGADVIKVEAPGGDITRSLGTTRTPGLASVYLACNRNKSSVVLDLKDAGDQEVVRDLISRADCLVHNMRVSATERLGIDKGSALAVNPRLVYASITGFGSDGPYSDYPAYDDCIQAATGMAWLQSLGDGEPVYMASAVADKVTGQAAVNAILAALYWREKSGLGQAVEVPMFETLAAFNLMEQWGGRAFEPAVGPTGYARLRSKYRRPYQTADGLISIVVYHEGHWRRFLELVGRTELLDRDEYRTVEARNRNIGDLYELVESLVRSRSTAEWLTALKEIDVPAMPILSPDDLFDDEHLAAVGFFQEVDDADGESYLVSRPAAMFSGSPLAEPVNVHTFDKLGAGSAAVARWLEHGPVPT